jgi:SAM-dependent methyltransferase
MSSSRPFYKPARVKRGYGQLLSEAREAYQKKGLYHVFHTGFTMVVEYMWLWYFKRFKSSYTFEFQGNTYHYFFHPRIEKTGPSWKNERAVALPIIWSFVKKYQEQKKIILEVGNVLSYVFKVNHDILDKYEITNGVINQDVVDFNPSKQYDLIVSILVLEHVGWSEMPEEPMKVLKAIQNLKRILAPGGQIVAVVGLGYNPHMDDLLSKGILQFDQQYYLKRISKYRWQQVDWASVKDAKYDESVPTSTGIVIGITYKP